MKARRSMAILLVLVIALTLGAQVQAQDGPTISPVACDEPGSLTMWVWDENWAAVIGEAIEAWKTDYCPGAEVDLQVQPWGQYWDLLRTNAAGGDLPDVFNMSQDNVSFYNQNGALLDLQPYWDAAGIDTSVWGKGLVDPYRYGEAGDLYAGPVNWDTVAIFYNKDMFDAAGLDYPTVDWTWDDFAVDAEKLTDAANDVYGAAVYLEYQNGYTNWIAAAGTNPVINEERTECTLTNEASQEALNYLVGLLDKGYMPSVSTLGGSSADDAFAYWISEHVAMIVGGSWKLPDAIAQAEFNWDIVQLPKHPVTGLSRSVLHAVGYVAAARTEVPDLAANLIIYLSSDEGQQFFAEAGGVAPANPSPALQQTWADSFADSGVNVQAFVDATADSVGVGIFPEIWDVSNTEIVVNIFDLGVPAADAAQMACDYIDGFLPQ